MQAAAVTSMYMYVMYVFEKGKHWEGGAQRLMSAFCLWNNQRFFESLKRTQLICWTMQDFDQQKVKPRLPIWSHSDPTHRPAEQNKWC